MKTTNIPVQKLESSHLVQLEEIENYSREMIFDFMTSEGLITGHLSSSPLSSAIILVCLKVGKEKGFPGISHSDRLIENLGKWLKRQQLADGGWGDSSESKSNFSTSLICYSAFFYVFKDNEDYKQALVSAKLYLNGFIKKTSSKYIRRKLEEIYEKDKTFAVPILFFSTYCLKNDWSYVPNLPYGLAIIPPFLWRFFNLQVVSYALPALIGIGYGVSCFKKNKFISRYLYRSSLSKKLSAIQPQSGGYLEATPLTGFVCFSLLITNQLEHPVLKK